MSIFDRVTGYLQTLIPTRKVTIYQDRYAPKIAVDTMDVDRVRSIIEASIDGDTRDLFALYRDMVLTDPHLQNEFGKRKLAVLGDALSIQPQDKKDPEAVKAADFCRLMQQGCASWTDACIKLLDSTLLPVALVEKVYRPSTTPGLRFDLAELVPVPDQLLDYSTGRMLLWATDPQTGAIMGQRSEPDPKRYIIHRGHLLTTADNRGGPMRSLVFWWLFSSMSPSWWARFLEKYGSPFLVGKYDQADDASRAILERAFQWAVRIGGLVVSRQTDVEIQQAAAAQSGEAYEKFLAVCQREKSKLILGQTLSSDSQPLGIGGGASKQQEGVRQDIRQWDSMRLGSTLEQQLFAQYLEINGIAGPVPSLHYGGEDPDAAASTGDLLSKLKQAGISVTDDGIATLSERFGIPLQRDTPPAPAQFLPGQAPIAMGARWKYFSSSPAIVDADHANDAIAREGSAPLSLAFRGALAPVRQMIAESTSAEDLQRRILSSYPDWSVSRVADLLDQAMIAYAANRLALPDRS